ncbi:MAG TPA: YceD family protein [Burkholderiales bacterium]|nr:YceD family protein [Burkholderiales bacterium]
MSGQGPAPAVIDSLEFARSGQTLRGSLPVPALQRLQDCLFDALGEVAFVVTGGHDARQRPTLTLEVSGLLHLRCQRCLGLLDYPLRITNRLLLASAAEAASGALDEDELEWIEASVELDVADLVEDEIILALPYAPRHEEGQCRAAAGAAVHDIRLTAFAALAALKDTKHKER